MHLTKQGLAGSLLCQPSQSSTPSSYYGFRSLVCSFHFYMVLGGCHLSLLHQFAQRLLMPLSNLMLASVQEAGSLVRTGHDSRSHASYKSYQQPSCINAICTTMQSANPLGWPCPSRTFAAWQVKRTPTLVQCKALCTQPSTETGLQRACGFLQVVIGAEHEVPPYTRISLCPKLRQQASFADVDEEYNAAGCPHLPLCICCCYKPATQYFVAAVATTL